MPEVGIAPIGANFRPLHVEGRIILFYNVFFRNRFGETGQTQTTVEFVLGIKERLAGNDVDVNAGPFVVPIEVVEKRLGPVFAGYAILLFSQPESQLGFARDGLHPVEFLTALFLFVDIAEENGRTGQHNRPKQPQPEAEVSGSLGWGMDSGHTPSR
jgi:hypothetical protein